MAEHFIIRFGKYKNQDVREVYNDSKKSYFQWLLNQPLLNTTPFVKEFLENKLIDKDAIYLSFGKYKGKTLDYIKQNDESYIYYLKGNKYVRDSMPFLYNAL